MVESARAALRAASFMTLVLCSYAAVAASSAPPHYTLDSARSELGFTFVQAGAKNTGHFGKFTADVQFSSENPAANRIDVTVDVASVETGDQERDDTLRGADLFNVAKFPQARFVSTKIVPTGTGRYEVQGKLTIRNVTRDLKLPITFQTKTEQGNPVAYLKGGTTIKRLDYGVGQGEWKSTEWVGDEVNVTFSLRLVPAT